MTIKHASSSKVLLGPVIQRYFGGYLVGQRELSPQTVSAYRDTFKLLLAFFEHQGIPPDAASVQDMEPSRILAFLDDLQQRRGNTARTRNARLAAIRSFLRYAVAADPLLLAAAQGVLAIPVKRFERKCVGHLTREQMQAILEALDPHTRSGERDRILLMLLYNIGARVSEVAGLRLEDVLLVPQASVHIRGIALWLGHENPQTTHQYLDADLETKKRALARLNAPPIKQKRARSVQPIMQFLKAL